MIIMIGGSCFAAAAPLIGEDLPVAYATGSLPPRDELPLINEQTALNLDYDSGGLEPHQVQKPGKSAPGGWVLSPTRCKNPAKVPLVVVIKECGFCQKPHSKHLTKSLPSQPKAPGAKTL